MLPVVIALAIAAVVLWSWRQIKLRSRVATRRRKRRRARKKRRKAAKQRGEQRDEKRGIRDYARQGREGELAAEKLLRRRGYTILSSQNDRDGVVWVNGERLDFVVRVDFLVKRWWRTYAVEVKTGESAPKLENRSTRRQLFEYSHIYDVDGLILADMSARELRSIRFRSRRSHLGWHSIAAAICLGALAGLFLPQLLGVEAPSIEELGELASVLDPADE